MKIELFVFRRQFVTSRIECPRLAWSSQSTRHHFPASMVWSERHFCAWHGRVFVPLGLGHVRVAVVVLVLVGTVLLGHAVVLPWLVEPTRRFSLCSRWRSCLAARANATFSSCNRWRSVLLGADDDRWHENADDDGILRCSYQTPRHHGAAADNLLIVCYRVNTKCIISCEISISLS